MTALAELLGDGQAAALAQLRIRLGQHQEQQPGRPVPVVFRPPAAPVDKQEVVVVRVCGECGRPLETA
jgi:hypothetical protein